MNSIFVKSTLENNYKRVQFLKKIFLLLFLWIIIQSPIHAEQPPPIKLTVNSRFTAGFFADLLSVISIIRGYEPLNLKELNVDWTQEFFPYKDNPHENGWDLFFHPIVFDNEGQDIFIPTSTINLSHCVHDQLCIHHWMAYNEHLVYRQSLNRVLNKYLKIKQPILDELSTLYSEHLEGYYCIGAHVRWGFAHGVESPKGTPTIEDYINEIYELMQKTQTSLPFKIYLATDSQEVIQAFEKHFSKELLYYLSAQRSLHREESHLVYDNPDYWLSHPEEFHKRKPGYRGGVAVLLDCLLLSKCHVFIHSTSNVSEFVSFFSPHIESIYLPKDARTWPCRFGVID